MYCCFIYTLLCITYMFGRLEPWLLTCKSQFLHCDFSAMSRRKVRELARCVQDSPQNRIKNGAAKFPCLPHSKKHKALPLWDCWKTLASLEEHLILFDFIIFSTAPLSLSFLFHWLGERVLIYLFIFISDSLPFLCCIRYCHSSGNKTTATKKKKKLFILKESWHRTNKSVSVHTMYLCHPSSSFFFFFNSSDRLFLEMKADIIFPVRPECLWNLSCCCSLITCTLSTSW